MDAGVILEKERHWQAAEKTAVGDGSDDNGGQGVFSRKMLC